MSLRFAYPIQIFAALLPRLQAAFEGVPNLPVELDTVDNDDVFCVSLCASFADATEREVSLSFRHDGVKGTTFHRLGEEPVWHRYHWSAKMPFNELLTQVCEACVRHFTKDYAQ